jgi:hypothetical protein
MTAARPRGQFRAPRDSRPSSESRRASPSRGRAARLPVILLALVATACDPGFPTSEGEARIDRETFVETYVDLRLAARSHGVLTEADRDRVLVEHGVTEEDLREFIEVHGRNVPYMNRVWSEVEARIAEAYEADPARPGELPAGPGEGGTGGPPDGPGFDADPDVPGPG